MPKYKVNSGKKSQRRRNNQFYLHVCVRGGLLKSFQSMGNIQKPSDTRLQGKQDPFYHLISLRIDEWSSSIFEKSITTIELGFKGCPVFRRAIWLFWFKVPTYLSTHIYGRSLKTMAFFKSFWHPRLNVFIITLMSGSSHILESWFLVFRHLGCVIFCTMFSICKARWARWKKK